MSESLGILGVGHLASHMVAGLRRVGDQRRIVLSPRNPERAKALEATHDCDIATDNQAVIDQCKVVLLAVWPEQLQALATEIAPTSEHLIISCIAGVSLDELKRLMPNASIVKTLPLASVEVGEGVVPIIPENATAQALLGPLGKLMVFDAEADFELAATAAALNGVVFGFMAELSDWFQNQGLTAEQSRDLVTHTLRGATGLAEGMPDQSLSEINASIATPGTFTRTAQNIITAGGGFGSWLKACEDIQRQLGDQSRNT